MTLRIQEGEFYRTRGGEKVGPMRLAHALSSYPWIAQGRGGRYENNGQHAFLPVDYDLVTVWIEIAPEDSENSPKGNAVINEDLFATTDTLTAASRTPTMDGSGLEAGGAGSDNDLLTSTFAPLETVLPDPKPTMRATDIASKASDLVGGDRDRQHGAKRDNFSRIAVVWNAWLNVRKDAAAPLDAHDVGVMMTLMKLARTQSGSLNIDDYIDACGYAACAGEVAQS